MPFPFLAARPARLKRSLIILVGGASVLASLSLWGRVPADALADADREVAQFGPARPGTACAAEGAVSRDTHGTFLMCWRQVWSRP